MRALLLVLLLVTVPFAFSAVAPVASATPVCPYGSTTVCCPGPCTVPWPILVVEEGLRGDPACPFAVSTSLVCSEITDPSGCGGYWLCVRDVSSTGDICIMDPCYNAAVCSSDMRVDLLPVLS